MMEFGTSLGATGVQIAEIELIWCDDTATGTCIADRAAPVAVTATAVDLRPVEWSKNILTGRDGQRHGRTGC
jgi:hypothetical protein